MSKRNCSPSSETCHKRGPSTKASSTTLTPLMPPSPLSISLASPTASATGLATPRTTCEPSHDGTVISPCPASLMQYAPTESFPIFQSGDVYIKSTLAPKHWQLHRSILARHSPWFARSLQEEPATWFSYTIEEIEGKIRLVRQPIIDGERPQAPDSDMVVDIAIKEEENEKDVSPRKDYNAIYNQIFGTFYSIPPIIDTSILTTALTQSEQLVETAHTLGSLHLLTPYISNVLLSSRQSLFRAISADPARWLILATAIQNDSIYIEALIHLAGAHPCWPWFTKRAALPEEIQHLIERKSRELDQMCLEAEHELLLLTIQVRGGPVQAHENSQFDTWFIVQTFRDVLAREFYALHNNSLKRGAVFRKIRKGGIAYMQYEEMRRLMERIMPGAIESLSEDLAMLKKSASQIVEELAVNELMLDVEASKVGYLTCIKVGVEDIPWRAGGR